MRRTVGNLVEGQQCLLAKPKDSILDTVRGMAAKNIGAVPVMDQGRLVGIFTERDVMKRVVAAGLDPKETRVEQAMTSDPDVCDADEGIVESLEKMRKRKCRHLPVLSDGKLLGLVSLRDLLGLLLDMKQDEIQYLNELFEYLPVEPGPGG